MGIRQLKLKQTPEARSSQPPTTVRISSKKKQKKPTSRRAIPLTSPYFDTSGV